MNSDQIKKTIKEKIQKRIDGRNTDTFLFGSFARGQHFHDIDIGVIGARADQLAALREDFEESTFPYEVDIVDFSSADNQFKSKIFDNGVLWLTRKKN